MDKPKINEFRPLTKKENRKVGYWDAFIKTERNNHISVYKEQKDGSLQRMKINKDQQKILEERLNNLWNYNF